MDERDNLSCCYLSLSVCGFKETCQHKGSTSGCSNVNGKSKFPQDFICLASNQTDLSEELESFRLMKKMFILKECGYWRSCD